MVTVKMVKVEGSAIIPKYQTAGAAGLDLHASESAVIAAGSHATISTGLMMEIPQGWEGQVRSRSGLAAKNGVFVLNSPGTVDVDFRGIIKVILANMGTSEFRVKMGDRIAQIVFAQAPQVAVTEVDIIEDTARGAGGFGSTGV